MKSPVRRTLQVAAALLVATLLFDLYARFPARFSVRPLALEPQTRSAVLVFHGSWGADDPTVKALEERIAILVGARPGIVVRRYLWSPYSDTRFRAAVNGARVGQELGAELAGMPTLESLHLIAHSAGAYIPGPLCEALRQVRGSAVRVDVTYLDPIGFQGVLDAGWGSRNFGRCGDYVEAIINTDDPAPATNAPLRLAWNLDVTAAAGRASWPGRGHLWPVQYYLEQVTAEAVLPGAYSHADRPRGAVETR